jgi:hypothetical protein
MPNAVAAVVRPFVLLLAVAMPLAIAAPSAWAADAAAAKKTGPKTAGPKKATAKAATAKAAAKKPVPAAEAVKQMVEGEDVRDFRSFCNSWMEKLRERTTYNTAHIPWTKEGAGVSGEYLSYGTTRTCIAKEEPGKDPIGKITYREIRYRKEGPTEAAALAGVDAIVEQTDVTEIFRYAKGRWQY